MKQWQNWLAPMGLVLVLGFFYWVGLTGIRFGKHWDEDKLLLSASSSMKEGDILPGWYNYPSVSFDIALVTGYTLYIDQWLDPETQPNQTVFKIRTRTAFLLFSGLTLVFLYLLVVEATGMKWTGLAAAALLATSWQFGYHARFIAPDTLMAAWATGAIWLCLRYLRTQKLRTLIWAAVLAGLAMGTKYPAGLLIVPLVLAVMLEGASAAGERVLLSPYKWKRIGWAMLAFFGVFFLTSPGILIEFSTFVKDLTYEMDHYGTGHRGHNVKPYGPHLSKILLYLGGETVYWASGLGTFVVAFIVGIYAMIGATLLQKGIKHRFWVLISFLSLYLLYFSMQKVMIVRNYMVLVPFVIMFLILGFSYLLQMAKKLMGTGGYLSIVIWLIPLFFLPNTLEVVNKAKSMQYFQQSLKMVELLEEHLEGNEYKKLYFSPRVQNYWEFNTRRESPYERIAGKLEQMPPNSYVAMFSLEPTNLIDVYQANDFMFVEEAFGPLGVDLNYYPFWKNNLLIIVPGQYAEGLKLKLESEVLGNGGE